MGWDRVGREKNKPSKKGACHEVESGQGEVPGHNTEEPVCLVSKMIMNAWCMCLM